MTERTYQAYLIRRLHEMFPGCMVIKNDASYIQGIPDLLILFWDKWAMLEVKLSEKSPSQPNQDHYIRVCDEMSFAAFIYPENERDVLDELQQSFGSRR